MSERLNANATIRVLAHDLGLPSKVRPVQQITHFCEQRIGRWLAELPGKHDATTILDIAAAKLSATIIEVHTEAELIALQQRYVSQGEAGFAFLKSDFDAGVLGITLRLLRRKAFEPMFVSVINCIGRNCERAYFTKWHELVHLLTLTDQTRLVFKRTHVDCSQRDPEEALVDIVAGALAYHPKLLKHYAQKRLSFALVDEIREKVFSVSSRQAALLGITHQWPKPCVLLRIELAGKHNSTSRELRAVTARPNTAAIDEGVIVIPKFRVPQNSVIWSAFHRGTLVTADIQEPLELWTSSDGSQWSGGNFHVDIQRGHENMQVLLSKN
jgi:hypothetical protein